MPPAAVEPVSSLSAAAPIATPATPAATNAPAASAPAAAPAVPSGAPAAPASPASPAAAAPAAPNRFANPEAPAETAAPVTGEAAPAAAPAKTGEATPAAAPKPEDWTLAAPKDVAVPEPTVKEVEAFAKTHKLTKDVAEQILARDIAAENARAQRAVAEAKTTLEVTAKTWYDESMADPVIGGVNAKSSEALVNKAMLAFLPADMRKMVYDSPFIANLIFRRFAFEAAKMIPVEGGPPISGTKAPAIEKSPAERIYGKK